MMKWETFLILLLIAAAMETAAAQSSSLYLQAAAEPAPADPYLSTPYRVSPISRALAETSLTTVGPPEPRLFAINDLINIIIRETTSTNFTAPLKTEKEVEFNGKIDAFPRLRLKDLVDLQLENGDPDPPVKLGVDYNHEFEGDGRYSRNETITGRITARVVDIKPNGLLVVEARKSIRSDKEILRLVLTGTCRPEDVTAGNTILSTHLYDLNIVKEHEGDLRKSTKKGILTRLLEAVFNF